MNAGGAGLCTGVDLGDYYTLCDDDPGFDAVDTISTQTSTFAACVDLCSAGVVLQSCNIARYKAAYGQCDLYIAGVDSVVTQPVDGISVAIKLGYCTNQALDGFSTFCETSCPINPASEATPSASTFEDCVGLCAGTDLPGCNTALFGINNGDLQCQLSVVDLAAQPYTAIVSTTGVDCAANYADIGVCTGASIGDFATVCDYSADFSSTPPVSFRLPTFDQCVDACASGTMLPGCNAVVFITTERFCSLHIESPGTFDSIPFEGFDYATNF